MENLNSNGVDTRPFFRPIHLMPKYLNYKFISIKQKNDLVCNQLSESGFNLPSSSKLGISDLDYIINILNKYS